MANKYFMLILIIITISDSYGQYFKTVNVSFNRITTQNNSEEIIKGHIFFDSNKSVIITEKPIKQWMILENNVLVIYYPDDSKAFKIKSQNPVMMPFSQILYGLFEENLGLAKLGYTIYKNELHMDTMLIHWKPPKDLEKKIGEYIVSVQNKKLISTEIKNHDQKTIMYTRYDNHIAYGNQFFPLKMTSIIFSDKITTTEVILFEELIFNKPLPDNILKFRLPDNLVVKEVQW